MMNDKEKEEIKLRFAKCLQKLLEEKNMSLRGLAAASGLEYTNVQRASIGDVNVALTTIIAIADGLNIAPNKLFSYYEKVSSDEIIELKEEKQKKKRKKK